MLNSSNPVFYYQVYGITISSNQPLPGLVATSASTPADLWVELEEDKPSSPTQRVIEEALTDRFGWQIGTKTKANGTYYQLSFHGYGTVEFEISPTGNKIWATWTNLLLEEVTAILLGPVLGCALRLQGKVCLHSSVIAIDGHAIALIGVKGAGKSTTAAALAQRGYPILSDDVAVLAGCKETFLVQPGYPRLRLWKPAVNALYGSEVGLSRVSRQLDKHFVELNQNGASAWRFQPQPLPLAAIYILENRQPELASPTIKPISQKMGLMHLMTHRYPQFLTLDRDRQFQEFALLSCLAATVPIKQVHRPDELEKLPRLCEVILDDIQMFVETNQQQVYPL